jgi:hypothetical protein
MNRSLDLGMMSTTGFRSPPDKAPNCRNPPNACIRFAVRLISSSLPRCCGTPPPLSPAAGGLHRWRKAAARRRLYPPRVTWPPRWGPALMNLPCATSVVPSGSPGKPCCRSAAVVPSASAPPCCCACAPGAVTTCSAGLALCWSFFFNFSVSFKIPEIHINFLKYVENTIRLRKIQNKFL